MKHSLVKSLVATSLSAIVALSMASCSNGTTASGSSAAAGSTGSTYTDIELGTTYKDVKADLKVLTQNTVCVDNLFEDYKKQFKKIYPNVNITYEGITDYAKEIQTRISAGDWGDICMCPVTVDKAELQNYFVNFGTKDQLSKVYSVDMLDSRSFENNVYGIPSMANVQGILYNKKVFKDAGITELPKTPDEFINDLKAIKSKTKAIPFYTNFAAGWTMTAWDAYIDGGATGDADFVNTGLTKGKNPFSDRGDSTGPNAVYKVLYDIVSQGLCEDDPTTTDWEGCKAKLNNGEIGTMALGSWAITQMQAAGDHKDDVAYMPFPITVKGKQYAAAGPDYCYCVNSKSSEDNQHAALCYTKWLTEKSGYDASQGGISIVLGKDMPSTLASFKDIKLVVNKPAPKGEEALWNDINNDSELGINSAGKIGTEIVESATAKSKTWDQLVTEWNEKWTKAQQNNGVNK